MKGELAIVPVDAVWRLVCGGVGYRDKCGAGDKCGAKERRKIRVCTRGRVWAGVGTANRGLIVAVRVITIFFAADKLPKGIARNSLVCGAVVEFSVLSSP